MDPVSVEPRDMPFHLLEEITENFSKQRKLGSGAYGKVYMGVLNGEKIAVKVLHESLQLDDHKQQFQKEFENLASLQHPNIIRLLGYCYETRKIYVNHNEDLVFANKIDRALCFEYMHNKSLDKYLDDDNIGLDWHTSYAIIKGISNGLKYLHEELKSPMYHLDLKPANILLDDNMVPKVADFGLSRLIREEHTRITTSPVGTTGYLPPEYIKHQAISNKFDIFSLGVIIIKIMAGPTGYSQSTEICSQEFIELVHGSWRNRLHAASANALDSYCKQVKRCIEIALRSVDVDGHKRPTIGDIVHELNETETMCPFPYALRNNPASRMEQESHRTHIIEVEEKKAREEIREIENCFGEIVDNYKLEKMASYTGRPKTLEQRAREAWNLVSENDKDGKASRYVDGLKAMYGNGQSTLCLVYNATGGTLCQVANHDWYGYIGSAPYPAKIGNGQWAAFHHVHRTGEPSGSVGSVVYRGKNRDGQDQDYLVSWSTPWGFYYRNKAYCEIGGVDYFQKRWSSTYHKLINSDYSSNARSDGCEVEAKIGTGDSPKFIARITSR